MHLKYRADIDGLRAIAILSVVVFHINEAIFAGGFIGVDVFFVISGYLISGIIFRELDRGEFTFKNFYVRRIRRLYPALLTVMTSCLVLGWFVLLSKEYQILGSGILSGAAFFANFKLYVESGYFDAAAQLKPMLHLWSLSLEEQFYFCFPILLVLWTGLRRSLVSLSALIFGLFAVSWYLTIKDPQAGFYFPTRFWELLAGSFLAAIEVYHSPLAQKLRKNATAIVGLVLLAAGFVLINGQSAFPGWRALLPVLGSFLLILAGPQTVVAKLLSNRAFVAIGLISYPLYLWHWPALYFTKATFQGSESDLHRTFAVLAATGLSYLTYKFVEQPLRVAKGRGILRNLLIWNVAMIVAGSVAKDHGNGQPDRQFMPLNANRLAVADPTCPVNPDLQKKLKWCFSDKRGNIDSIVIGDSHADAFYVGLVREDSDLRWAFAGISGCAGQLGAEVTRWSTGNAAKEVKQCAEVMPLVIQEIAANPNIKNVLLVNASRVMNWNLEGYRFKTDNSLDARASLIAGLNNSISLFERSGKTVSLLLDNPAVTSTPELCGPRPISFASGRFSICAVSREKFERDRADYLGLIQELKSSHPGLLVYDPIDLYCDQTECPVKRDGLFYYSYSDHISDHANKIVGEEYLKWLKTQKQ